MRAIVLALILHASLAIAGSDSRDCETADKSVVMGGGNSPTRVKITYLDKGKPGVLEAPVKIMPQYIYNVEDTDELIVAVPITSERVVSQRHTVTHVKRKDGTSCNGREHWDDRSIQSYVLMAKHADSLRALDGKTVKGLTKDGYLVAEFRCHSYGVTSPGGCSPGPGDESSEVPRDQ